jgi:hypothetical protein
MQWMRHDLHFHFHVYEHLYFHIYNHLHDHVDINNYGSTP